MGATEEPRLPEAGLRGGGRAKNSTKPDPLIGFMRQQSNFLSDLQWSGNRDALNIASCLKNGKVIKTQTSASARNILPDNLDIGVLH